MYEECGEAGQGSWVGLHCEFFLSIRFGICFFYPFFLPILLSFIKQLGKENGEVGVSIFIYYPFALYILYFSSKNRYRSACRASEGIGNCSVHLCPGRWG